MQCVSMPVYRCMSVCGEGCGLCEAITVRCGWGAVARAELVYSRAAGMRVAMRRSLRANKLGEGGGE